MIRRGTCSFLTKAINVHKLNASALVIVNTEDRLESPSSGLGIDKDVSEHQVHSLKNLSVVFLSNISWASLEMSVKYSSQSNVCMVRL